MSEGLTNVQKIKALPWSIVHSAANSVFCQFTFFGSAFVLFLSEVGFSKTQIGSLLSFFPFSALMALFIAPLVARFGHKRTFVTFWGIRKITTALLLLTPWILSRFGSRVLLVYVVGIAAAFAISRAIAMTAMYPWEQEYVPNTVRGKYSATKSMFANVASFVAVMGAGYLIGESPDLEDFVTLFAIGVLFGLISVWGASRLPGGAPIGEGRARKSRPRDILATARDRSLLLYLAGASLISLATGPLGSFLPLFMQEQVGLKAGNVVLLSTGTLLGGVLSSYVWGWASDRYGSKPVMLSGVYLQSVLPMCWLLMPRHSSLSLYAAQGIAFLQGFVNMGWAIGSARLLFVSVVPPRKRTEYMALYYAWMGVVGGLGQVIGGRVLDRSAGITGQFLGLPVEPYTILFVIGIILPVAAGLLFREVRADSTITTAEFAGMFFQGNPLRVAGSLIGFHRAKDERATISMTERLGQTQSPLTVEELLEALADPRFYVRFEAIVSIARMKPDDRLIEALVEILDGNEPALSVIAAWALGRIGDEQAVGPLRQGLDARYRSVQAHCVRSLATLGDMGVVPVLLERLGADDADAGLQMAYASALGQLQVQEATDRLLVLLRHAQEQNARMELALALARIVGDEQYFIQLLRQARTEIGTATSQAVIALKKTLSDCHMDDGDLMAIVDRCAEDLAQEDLESGVALISQIIRLLPVDELGRVHRVALQDFAERLDEFGVRRTEYVVLALHTIRMGLAEKRPGEENSEGANEHTDL
jgi:MFS family permease